ncbi:hypothetical protein GQ53DRAFT_842026 [Thozetella sp. PMI_491]|nr:hypothetical protein GQ53DRAFT_842026 [Thozetella sp. PMI_491]
MSSLNPLISNGTCYYTAGKQMDKAFIPCGNDAVHHYTCCSLGDLCLGGNACWHWGDGEDVTYLAGCSDSSYSDPSCPNKGAFQDQPWAGLVYCNGTSDEWVACSQSGAPTTITKGSPCWCPQSSRTVAITAVSTLPYIASLPQIAGGSPSYQPGYTPTFTPTPSPSTTSSPTTSQTPTPSITSSPLTTSGSSAQATSSSASLSSSARSSSPIPSDSSSAGGGVITGSSSGGFFHGASTSASSASSTAASSQTATGGDSDSLSTGTKAGIGVGAGLGGVALIALIGFLLSLMLRRRQRNGSLVFGPESDLAPMPGPEKQPTLPFGMAPMTPAQHIGQYQSPYYPQPQYGGYSAYAPTTGTSSTSPGAQSSMQWQVPSHGMSGSPMMTSGLSASELEATGVPPGGIHSEVEGNYYPHVPANTQPGYGQGTHMSPLYSGR